MKKLIMTAAAVAALGASAITEDEIEKLIGTMTLDEKIGQMVQLGSGGNHTGGAESSDASKGNLPADVVEWIRKGEVGSLIGACGVEKFNAFQKIAMTEARVKIPLMVGHDMVHGCRTQWPIAPMLACSWDEELWERCGRITALETPSKGCNWTFAPMVDIARDARWGRIAEGCGVDPLLASRMCAALVKGIQAKDVKYPIAACLKHYAGYGAATAGRDYYTVEIEESTFRNVYLPPFKAGIEAGVMTVMPAFNTLNGVPCSVNKWLLTDILRDELGFKGFCISDWNAIGECVSGHAVAQGVVDASAMAVNAGMDQDMMSEYYKKGLKTAVEKGLVSEKTIDERVRNILRVKNQLGLFEHPYIDAKEAEAQVDFEKFGEIVREAAARSMVLLKNDNGVLPLRKDTKILAVGPGWENKWHFSGAWSSYVENDAHIYPLKEFKAAGLDFKYRPHYDFRTKTDKGSIAEDAAQVDVIVAMFGENGGESGEGWSKQRIELPEAQLKALDELKATGKPVIAILNGGRPMAVPELAEKADAILFIWSPGTSAGTALVDVLTGKVNPEGRLVVDMPYSTGQMPLFYNRLPSSRPTDKVGNCCSCYRDGPWTALYPFGYGLSYTSFAYANEKVEVVGGGGEGAKVVFSCDVTNTGKVAGTETVQAYTRQFVGVESRPIRELRGWQKLTLAPGETKRAEIVVPASQLAYWAKDKLVPAKGKLNGWICRDSVSGKPIKISL